MARAQPASSAAACGQALAEGTLLADYQAPNYKREAPERNLAALTVVEFDGDKLAAIEAGVRRGEAIAHGVITARDLSNEPPNVLFPVEFASRAAIMSANSGLHLTVLGEEEMAALNMNILLAVSRGSANEAQLIILEHAPEGTQEQAPLVLVGKGITFDTGGISIKPSERMEEMKHDMSGAAAVVGAMEAIARLGVPRRVIGVAACVENMPDGNAFRPGDILVGMTGKSTEILSTDAEGRLILADALAYVARFEPKAVVDLATLTGAIGDRAWASRRPVSSATTTSCRMPCWRRHGSSGERLWPMPMWDEYMDDHQERHGRGEEQRRTRRRRFEQRQVYRALHRRLPVGAPGHRQRGLDDQREGCHDAQGRDRLRRAPAGRPGRNLLESD